ncbi:hypothetical protein KEM56_001515, partial [Ascosphaera pollenicola]
MKNFKSPLGVLMDDANAGVNAQAYQGQGQGNRLSRSSTRRGSKRDELMRTAVANNAAQKGLALDFGTQAYNAQEQWKPTAGIGLGISAIESPEDNRHNSYQGWVNNDVFRPASSVYSRGTVARSVSSPSANSNGPSSSMMPPALRLHVSKVPMPAGSQAGNRPELQESSIISPSDYDRNSSSTSQTSSSSNPFFKRRDPSNLDKPLPRDSQIVKPPVPLKLHRCKKPHIDTHNPFDTQPSPVSDAENEEAEETIVSIPRNQAILTDRKHMSQGWWDILGQPFSMDEKELQRLAQMMPQEYDAYFTRKRNTIETAATSESGYVGGSNMPKGFDGAFSSARPATSECKQVVPMTPEKAENDGTAIAPTDQTLPVDSSPRRFDNLQPVRPPLHVRRGLEISHIHTFQDKPRPRVRRPVRRGSCRREIERRPSNNITIQTINIITSGQGDKAGQKATIQSVSPVINAVFVQSPRNLQEEHQRTPSRAEPRVCDAQEDERVKSPSTVPFPAPVNNRHDGSPIPATHPESRLEHRRLSELQQGCIQQQGSSPHLNTTIPVTIPEQSATGRETRVTDGSDSTGTESRSISTTSKDAVAPERAGHNLPPYSPTDPRFDSAAAAAYIVSTVRQSNGHGHAIVETSSFPASSPRNSRSENNERNLLADSSRYRGNSPSSSRPHSIDIFNGAAVLKGKGRQRFERKDTDSNDVSTTPWPDDAFFKNGAGRSEIKPSASQSPDHQETAIDRRAAGAYNGRQQSFDRYRGHATDSEAADDSFWGSLQNDIAGDRGIRSANNPRSQRSNTADNHYSTNTQFPSPHIHSDNHRIYRPTPGPSFEKASSGARRSSSSSDRTLHKSSKMNHTTSNVETVTTTTTAVQKPSRTWTCFSNQSKKKRPWLWVLLIILILLIVAASVLPPVLYHTIGPGRTRWVHPDNFPALPTGISTVAGTNLSQSRDSCVAPSTLWSCSLPKEEQQAEKGGYKGNQPSFMISIKYQDPNNTKTSDSQAVGLDNFVSWPEVPGLKDMRFMGNTTDGVQGPNYAGEETPFWVTLLSPSSSSSSSSSASSARMAKRDNKNSTANKNHKGDDDDDDGPLIKANMTSPNPEVFLPRPLTASDGTALPAQLYPLVENQPLRLYNRGSDDEHYGFYTYFDRRIFIAGVSSSDNDTEVADQNGGSTKQEAKATCFWGSTRFFVQMWTSEKTSRRLLGPAAPSKDLQGTDGFSLTSASAIYTAQPGSFPYPVTVTIDRHGGVTHDKMIYCYGLDGEKRYILDENRIVDEDRGKGGKLIDAAPDLYLERSNKRDMPSSEEGKEVGDSIDGGTGG